jgi:hypothetical protein
VPCFENGPPLASLLPVGRTTKKLNAGKRKEIAQCIISGRKSSAENGTSLQHRLANPTEPIDSATVVLVAWSVLFLH